MSEPTTEELHSAMFAQLVMQQANLAMMLLGQMPHPESGETMRDLDGARVFISQLEMLEAKTRGNLTPPEEAMLKQTLMSLRLAFVEAVNTPETSPAPTSGTPVSETENSPPDDVGGEQSAKRFSKKYS